MALGVSRKYNSVLYSYIGQSVSSFGGSRLSSQLPPPPLHTPPISVYTQQKIQCCM